jgi:sulfur carrier protein ThiS
MQIHIKLFSRFRTCLPRQARGEATIEMPGTATVGSLLEHLGIEGRVKLITINGEREADRDRVLQDNDLVRIFPVVVGG